MIFTGKSYSYLPLVQCASVHLKCQGVGDFNNYIFNLWNTQQKIVVLWNVIFISCFASCILFVGGFSHNVHEIPNFATILIKVLFINILSMEWIKLMSIKIEIKQYNCSFSSFRIFRIKIH